MNLAVEAKSAVLQALDHVEAPQRPGAIERLRVQAGDRGLELGHRAWRGQRDADHMLGQVDGFGPHPHRIGEVERHVRQLPREDG